MTKKTSNIRVRFAPSPTGPLHVGGARTALFNFLFAKNNNGKFILRIEDTDKERSLQKWTEEILDQLKWLGINWDEGPDIDGKFGPYKQTQRLDIYKKYLEKLLKENKAYFCFCSEEDLESKRQEQLNSGVAPKYDGTCSHLSKTQVEENIANKKESVIRFRVESKKVKFKDLIRGDVEFDTGLLGDIVIAKNLDTPLYHFAVVVDDFEMQISHVIRGEEHLSNTPRQILLQEALDFYKPVYAHLPLMLNSDRSKMSKRQGDVAVSDYRIKGYLPEALINFMVLLGWNSGTEKEIYSIVELEKDFSIEKVQKAGAVFNLQRLDFINGFYIREKSIKKLTELCIPYLKEAGLLVEGQVTEHQLEKIIDISRQRMKKLSELPEMASFFFTDDTSFDKDLLKWQKMENNEVKDSLLRSKEILLDVRDWNLENLKAVLFSGAEAFNKEKGYPEKNKGYLLWPLRVALSGKEFSPSPFEIADILGREKTIKRIEKTIKLLG